jgi:ADP-ribose pyrophosphatase YjhB (NUDIX family)
MKTYFVVTGVLKFKDKILILKKAPNDYNYPNKWSFCSGFTQEFETGEDNVLREIKEETGLDAKIVKTGKIMEVIDGEKRWVIAVYLCETDKDDVKLCHENVDFKWVKLGEFDDYDFVPGLIKKLDGLGLE